MDYLLNCIYQFPFGEIYKISEDFDKDILQFHFNKLLKIPKCYAILVGLFYLPSVLDKFIDNLLFIVSG